MGDVLGAARELERSLAHLLALLDAHGTPSQALGQAALLCTDGFEALRASIESGPEESRANLAGVLRANSIARDVVSRQQADLSKVLERVRAARRGLAQLGGGSSPGESCDLTA